MREGDFRIRGKEISFLLFGLWRSQYTFFRRYGIEDTTIVMLAGVLLFVVRGAIVSRLLIGRPERRGGVRVRRDGDHHREQGRDRAPAAHAHDAARSSTARGVAAHGRDAGTGADAMTRRIAGCVALLATVAACSKSAPPPPPVRDTLAATSATSAAAVPGDTTCPATGSWAKCSVLYRLDRAGLAPHLDSAATPDEKSLSGSSFVVKIGSQARLEVFLYPDSLARIADEKRLDKSKLVGATAPQTILRERTLIENDNLVALLTSINDHQRERVSDALTAGPPQPPSR